MLKNYLTIALRNMLRHKGFTFINISGLAIGMAAFLVIMLFVDYELSFDSIHKNNIYRLDEVQQFEGMVAPQNVALSMYPMVSALLNDYPEVVNATHINANEKVPLVYGEKKV